MMETTKLAKTLECFVRKTFESSCLIFELCIKIAKKLHTDCVNVQDWELDNNLMVPGWSPNQYVTLSWKPTFSLHLVAHPQTFHKLLQVTTPQKSSLYTKRTIQHTAWCLMQKEEWGYSNQPRLSCHQKKLYAAILLQKCQVTWDCGIVSCMSPFEPFHHSCLPHAAIVPPATQPYKLNQMTSLLCARVKKVCVSNSDKTEEREKKASRRQFKKLVTSRYWKVENLSFRYWADSRPIPGWNWFWYHKLTTKP
jgi:hypothetical protein